MERKSLAKLKNVKISTAATNDKAENCVYINQCDFNANFETSLTEETVIVEEISQDATEKWLDTFSNSGSHCITNSVFLNVESAEMPETLGEQLASESDNELNNYENIHQQEASSSGKNTNKSVCKFCTKTFPTANRLNWHIRTHDKNRKRFICPAEQCGRIYASKQSCEIHYKQTHLDEGYMCQICRKIFSAKQTLEVHMRYHTKVYPYKCDLCDRKFAQKGHLTQHIEVKHQNLRYICPEPDCCKVFQNSVSLRNHHYTHSSMPFKCSHCDKQYPQKNKLKNHLLHKHNIKYSLEDLEEMRQFNIIRTRHAFVKVQAKEVQEHKHTAEESAAG